MTTISNFEATDMDHDPRSPGRPWPPFARAALTFAGALVALGSTTAAHLRAQVLYAVTDLGAPGSADSFAEDINDRGEVLVRGSWPPQAFVHDPVTGALTSLGAPVGQTRFEGTRINVRGQVVGAIGGRQYVHTPGVGFVDLGELAAGQDPGGRVCGINGRGEIVGTAVGLAPATEAYWYSPATGMLAVSAGTPGYLCDLNDAGEAIGRLGNQWGRWLHIAGGVGVFTPLPWEPDVLREDGAVAGWDGTDIVVRDRFGATTTVPAPAVQHNGITVRACSTAGVVGGRWQYYVQLGNSTIFRDGAFLHVPGRGTVDLGPATNGLVDPAWEVEGITAMNELGQLVGYGRLRGTLDTHAIRLDPIGRAAGVTTLGAGCAAPGAAAPTLQAADPVVGWPLQLAVAGTPAQLGLLLLGFPAAQPLVVRPGCPVHVDLAAATATAAFFTDAQGAAALALPTPAASWVLGLRLAAQAAVFEAGGGFGLTPGLELAIGF